jgi:hypothetical protein
MTDPVVSDVTILPPSTALQRKVGGSVARLLSPEKVRRAEKELEVVAASSVRPDIIARLQHIRDLAATRAKDSLALVWSHAHEIRGMAANARMARLGVAADLMCRYLDDSPAGFTPDPNVLTTIVVTSMQAAREGAETDPLVAILLVDCAKAVDVQRAREGRKRSG